MPAFRFFDPWAPLENADEPLAPAKGANAAKPATAAPPPLATLAALAAPAAETENAAALHPATAWEKTRSQTGPIPQAEADVPRAWAEGFARLDPGRPAGDVPPHRWRRFVDDVALFLDQWAARAAALGWEAPDLFGCDPGRPFARIDQAGLLWLLQGDRLVALSDSTAVIETRTGARQIWHRKPVGPGRVLAWELAR